MADYKETTQRNLNWFQNSGVMRPADGFWGVAERIAVIADDKAAAEIDKKFPCQTQLQPEVAVIEHRRAV